MPSISPTMLAVLTIGVVALILGILIGYYAIPAPMSIENRQKLDLLRTLTETHYSGQDDQIVRRIIDEVNANNIRDNLKFLTLEPHLVGSRRNYELGVYFRDSWLQFGLDQAYLIPYTVLLSFSNQTNPNKVQILDQSGNVVFQSRHQESPIGGHDYVHAFHSYAPQADVTGEPVYCNFGRASDFDLLEKHARINLTGKICIMKNGRVYRGNKCQEAAMRKCVGCILYSDPLDIAVEGTEASKVFPNTWWMPGDAMQRGSVRLESGDPQTPGFPSIDGAFRFDPKDTRMPRIPSQPIGYDDAREILKIMGGVPVPNTTEFSDWRGALNISYHLGPGFNSQNANKKLRLIVNNQLIQKTVYNAIGVLKGSVEPDRYVLMGSHRDAWGFGGLDATSGGVALFETSRVLGKLHKEINWRPRRTLVFCSWDAEEFAIIGSTEWVEDHINLLSQRAVAYINVDVMCQGPHLEPDASSSLMELFRQVTKSIPYVNGSGQSLYENWVEHEGWTGKPRIATLGSGSDHAPFSFFAGVPAINIEFLFDDEKYPIGIYPSYHTYYDTFSLVGRFVDPGYEVHACGAKLAATLMHVIADSTLLPFDYREMAQRMQEDYDNIWTDPAIMVMTKNEVINGVGKGLVDTLETSIKNFSNAANEWNANLKKVDLNNPLEVRQMNDLMMAVERSFIIPEGLHDRPDTRNVLYAPVNYNNYAKTAFPGLLDLMYLVKQSKRKSATEQRNNWNLLGKHISDIAILTRSASRLLKGGSFEI